MMMIERYMFGNRIVEGWNKLPKEIVSAKTLNANAFRNRLHRSMDSKDWVLSGIAKKSVHRIFAVSTFYVLTIAFPCYMFQNNL